MSNQHNYKLTEIGKIPYDWDLISLEDIADKNDKHSFIDGDWIEAKYITNEGTRLIQTGNIGIGNFKEKETKKYISEESFTSLKCKEVYTGDILICRLADPIGRACIVPDIPYKMITAVDVVIFRPQKSYSKEFINYALNFNKTLNMVASFASGSTRQRISRTNLGKLLLPIPNISEQQKIAAILSSVDEAIKKTEAIIEQTEKVKKGLMQQLFTKGIGHTKFKSTRMGEIPEDWEVLSFNDVLSFIGSGITPKGGSAVYQSEGIPFIRSQNVYPNGLRQEDIAFISDTIHEKMKRSKVQERDVLLNITGASIGRCTYVPTGFGEANVNQHVCILRSNEKIYYKYLAYFINSSLGLSQISFEQAGQTREGLNYQQIRAFNISVPPLSEQEKIANIIDSFNEKTNSERKKLNAFQCLKMGLMQNLLTGKVRVKVNETEVTQV